MERDGPVLLVLSHIGRLGARHHGEERRKAGLGSDFCAEIPLLL